MINEEVSGFLSQAEKFVNACSSNHPLYEHRLVALNTFKALGVPTPHQEDWKYTDLKHLLNRNFLLQSYQDTGFDYKKKYKAGFVDLLKTKINKLVRDNNSTVTCLLMLDGEFIQELSVFDQSVLSDNQDNYIHSIKNYSNEYRIVHDIHNNIFHYNSIAQFVNAAWHDGLIINLNNKIKNKIILLNVYTEHSSNLIINSKHSCYLSNNTELELKEIYTLASNEQVVVNDWFALQDRQNIGPVAFSNNILFDISLYDNSKCDHYILNDHSADNYNIASYCISQEKDSEYNNYNFDFGGKLSRKDIVVKQNSSNSATRLYGLFVPKNTQHMDTHLKIFHNASYGESLQDYVGVLFDRGHAVLNNMVHVAENIKQITAKQNNKNLLLSKNAEVNTKPELQIHAKDVYCAHGATIGRLDETAMFYLRSRGIGQVEAKKILIQAFINELLNKIKDPQIVDWVNFLLTTRLSVIE